jgi:hypothetical protein
VRTLHTRSGAVYEYKVEDGTPLIRRINPEHEKRGDGEWQVLLEPLPDRSLVGAIAVLVLSSLARYGEDDHGTPCEIAARWGVTTRVTTTVVSDTWGGE